MISHTISHSYLLPDRGKGAKQKTGVCRRTQSPKWEHTLSYENVSLAELADRSLEVSVWDHDRLGHNEMLGGVRFNLGIGEKLLRNVCFSSYVVFWHVKQRKTISVKSFFTLLVFFVGPWAFL